MLGIAFGSIDFTEGEPCCDCDGCSRTSRTAPVRFSGEVVVAEENAESEFVESIRRTVSCID